MKVIGTSNFADESVADFLVEDNLSAEAAETLAKQKNTEGNDNSYYYYRTVEDDYRLWGGMSELV